MGKKIIRFFAYVLTAAMFLFGVLIFVYPLLSGHIAESNSEVHVKNFENFKNSYIKDNQPANDGESQGISSENNGKSEAVNKLYEEMQQYNADIYENHQTGLCDAWAYEQSSVNLSEFGINNGAVAVLKVPKMGIEMPIFLGASRYNMSMGAAQLGETSMPIGGINTNCVLAGHRGWNGAKYFLDIEAMQLGDMVYIENLWETLTYKVTDIKIIYPNEIDKVLIQEGKDMVTLFTCHPYWASTYRYVVFCERVYGENSSVQSPETQITNTDDTIAQNNDTSQNSDNAIEIDKTSQTRILIERISYIVIPILLIILCIVLILIRYKK